ncbi:MAG: hypothetical protein AB7I98_14010 [Verrucomicrobiales bacterium]
MSHDYPSASVVLSDDSVWAYPFLTTEEMLLLSERMASDGEPTSMEMLRLLEQDPELEAFVHQARSAFQLVCPGKGPFLEGWLSQEKKRFLRRNLVKRAAKNLQKWMDFVKEDAELVWEVIAPGNFETGSRHLGDQAEGDLMPGEVVRPRSGVAWGVEGFSIHLPLAASGAELDIGETGASGKVTTYAIDSSQELLSFTELGLLNAIPYRWTLSWFQDDEPVIQSGQLELPSADVVKRIESALGEIAPEAPMRQRLLLEAVILASHRCFDASLDRLRTLLDDASAGDDRPEALLVLHRVLEATGVLLSEAGLEKEANAMIGHLMTVENAMDACAENATS